jgi:hypothetical protein
MRFVRFFFVNTAPLHWFSFVLLSASGFSWFFFSFNAHKQETLCARLSLLPTSLFRHGRRHPVAAACAVDWSRHSAAGLLLLPIFPLYRHRRRGVPAQRQHVGPFSPASIVMHLSPLDRKRDPARANPAVMFACCGIVLHRHLASPILLTLTHAVDPSSHPGPSRHFSAHIRAPSSGTPPDSRREESANLACLILHD